MKLKDLSEMVIQVGRQTEHGIDLSVFKNFTKIGTIENYDFWISDVQQDRILGKLVDENDVPFAYIILEPIVGLKTRKSPVRVRRTWVDPKWRNKGVMTSIYKNLVMKFKFALISDIEFSPETESIWKRLYNDLKPNIIDSDTSNIFKPKSFDEVFENPRYSFILEWNVAPCFEHKDHPGLKDLSVYINRTDLP